MRWLLHILLILLPVTICAQGNIRIQGTVVAGDRSRPLDNVRIAYSGMVLGYTSQGGKYSVLAPADATLRFYLPDYEAMDVRVDGRETINISLLSRVVEIEDVVVVVEDKIKLKSVYVEPSEIVVEGGRFNFSTFTKLPDNMFSREYRYIFQPKLINDTRSEQMFFEPMVIDGDIFTINNKRLHEGELREDILQRFSAPENAKDQENHEIYRYSGSLEVPAYKRNDSYRIMCYMSINGLAPNHKDYLDSLEVARGTKFPLRFLDYNYAALPYNDRVPTPQLKKLSVRGVSSISFKINKAKIDTSDPMNQQRIDDIKDKITEVLTTPYATVSSISIMGYASPDGVYSSNKWLASQRMKVILDELRVSIPDSLRSRIKLTSDSEVDKWSSVAKLMLRDKHPKYSEVSKIIARHGDDYVKCGREIKRLKYYRSVIAKVYLPQLRRVEYAIDYSTFRRLSDDEIWERYDSGNTDISRYEYWRMIESASNDEDKAKIEDIAIIDYPDFEIVANRVALRAIDDGVATLSILQPSLEKDPPSELLHNQALIAMELGETALSDSLLRLIPRSELVTYYIYSIIEALNGNYAAAMPAFREKGGLNEVLLLLAMDRNQEATEKIKRLLENTIYHDNAEAWYVRAICANRQDDITMAMSALQRAINIDPSLVAIAASDSDVLDVLNIIKQPQSR